MRASAAASRHAVAARLRGLAGAMALACATIFTVPCPAAPAPAAAPNEAQPKNGAKPPESVKPLPSNEAASVLGKKVKGPNGEDLGLIVDVLVDPDGQPRAAVIDFGGFLGVGTRKIAIDWKALDFGALGRAGTVELGLDRAAIAAAPEYKPGPPGADVVIAPTGQSPPADTHK